MVVRKFDGLDAYVFVEESACVGFVEEWPESKDFVAQVS
jgi:hypothetical protein